MFTLESFKTSGDEIPTHLSFIGGKYTFKTNEALKQFHDYYFKEITIGHKMYLIERVTDVSFKFFIDIDTYTPDKDKGPVTVIHMESAALLSFIQVVSGVLDSFFEHSPVRVVVSRRLNKYHLNYPDVVVDSDTANAVISDVMQKMDQKFVGTIDPSVYCTGLRMLGSRKRTTEAGISDANAVYRMYNPTTEKYLPLTRAAFDDTLIHACGAELTKLKSGIDITHRQRTQQKRKCPHANNSPNKRTTTDMSNAANANAKALGDLEVYLRTSDGISGLDLRIGAGAPKYVKMDSGVNIAYIPISMNKCPFKGSAHLRDSSPLYLQLSPKKIVIKCHDDACRGKTFGECPLPSQFLRLLVEPLDPGVKQILLSNLGADDYKIAKAIFELKKNVYCVDDIRNSQWYLFNGVTWEKSFSIETEYL